ncbi:B12-binding domain-containing radical SAM protein [Bacillus solimangrovi]|uniref:B12-binding domain-containing radical SAM protein n=1 Tax=Bacillus solimangrovi TaxID=1305675 RepID=A0A1E5LD64_9BACI|nr:B12-binding domain-containing radical SAM protein [Bacillus solimangrovi]OEH92013.1 B12-binding domain-containing radical SAM protein [Bacillus solimangrovi]
MKIILSTLNAKYIHTNLALRYLKAYSQDSHDIDITEYTIKDPIMNIVSDLHTKKPDILGFSCYIWNIQETIDVIKMLKKIHPNLFIVLGGPEVTYDTADWMQKLPEVDGIVVGEGEETFKQLLDTLHAEGDLENVDGLAYRDEHGEVRMNPKRQKVNLKEVPSPYRFEEDKQELGKRISYIETSRGCPFSCQFCLSSIEVGVRYFDKEKIKEDIMYLMENGAKVLKFVDRTFNISRSYAMDMFQFIIDNHLPGTVFQFEITADIMRPEVIEFLNENAPAGLIRFEIGVQSTNDYTNELVQRKQNFSKLSRTVSMVKEGGKIVQHLDLIAGLPEEDYASFRQTFNDVFAFEVEELQLGFLKLLRGTGLRVQREQFGYIHMDKPPYEILGNNVLTFDEIIRIKQVEDVLEKYWNDHRMDHTIRYLVHNVFETPFDFFQSFGSYWEERGWSRIGHQLEDLFRRLHEFLSTEKPINLTVVQDLMKYDYLKSMKHKPRKPWWGEQWSKKEKSMLLKYVEEHPHMLGESFSSRNLSEKDLHKHTIIEQLSFDLHTYLTSGQLVHQETFMLIHYDQKTNDNHLFTFEADETLQAIKITE